MREIEKLFYWFIPLFVLEFMFTGGAGWFLGESMKAAAGSSSKLSGFLAATGTTPMQAVGYLTAIKSWLSLITQLAVGVWLFFSAKRHGVKAWLWGLFGCVTGVLAIAIFYLALILENQRNGVPSKT